jgi:hypothetical protein
MHNIRDVAIEDLSFIEFLATLYSNFRESMSLIKQHINMCQ